VGFFAGGKLKKVSLEGGTAFTIADAPWGLGASWGADDNIVYVPSEQAGLWQVSAGGGEPEGLMAPDFAEGGSGHGWPQHLPDGKSVLFTMWGGTSGDVERVAVFSLESHDWRLT